MRKTTLFGLLVWAFASTYVPLWAQEAKEEPTFFTGLSPVILERNSSEINLVNSMTSYWIVSKQFTPDAPTGFLLDRRRFSRSEHLLRASYGFSKSKRWDLGVELKYTQARLDDAARSSPFRVFGNSAETGTSYRGLTGIGLRIRTMPFKKIPELTVQGTVSYPQNAAASTENQRAQLGAQSVQAGLAATYYSQAGEKMFYFFQADWATQFISADNKRTKHSPSLSSTIVVKAWEDEWFVFGGLNYGMSLQQFSNGGLYRLSQAVFGSGGVFYQPTPKFSIVVSAQLPFMFESSLRSVDLVRESFSGFTVGMRSLL